MEVLIYEISDYIGNSNILGLPIYQILMYQNLGQCIGISDDIRNSNAAICDIVLDIPVYHISNVLYLKL